MLLMKSNGSGGGPAGDMLMDGDDEDLVSSTSSSTPSSRGIRNFFRKRHKSVTVGSDKPSSKLFR